MPMKPCIYEHEWSVPRHSLKLFLQKRVEATRSTMFWMSKDFWRPKHNAGNRVPCIPDVETNNNNHSRPSSSMVSVLWGKVLAIVNELSDILYSVVADLLYIMLTV